MSDILGILRSFEPRADNPRILVTHAIQATRDAALDEYNTLREASAILAAVREEDDLVSRLESVAMSWCLAGLADALDRVKPLSVRYGRMTDLADALKYAMGQQTTAGRMQVLTSLLDREPDGDTGADADE